MATFEIVEGPPGQGKSLYTARRTMKLLARNKKYYKRLIKDIPNAIKHWEEFKSYNDLHSAIFPQKRLIYSNLKFSEDFEKVAEGYLAYWSDSSKLVKLYDCDIIWDEIATELDSRSFAELSIEMKRFLSQYRKRGIDIYANTQDFSMIDKRARLMISGVQTLTKIIGSRDISSTKPKPKTIWGIVMIRNVQNYREDDPEKKKYDFIPSFLLIEKSLVEIYDTRQDIPMGEPAPLKHRELKCEYFGIKGHPCQFHHKIVHS